MYTAFDAFDRTPLIEATLACQYIETEPHSKDEIPPNVYKKKKNIDSSRIYPATKPSTVHVSPVQEHSMRVKTTKTYVRAVPRMVTSRPESDPKTNKQSGRSGHLHRSSASPPGSVARRSVKSTYISTPETRTAPKYHEPIERSAEPLWLKIFLHQICENDVQGLPSTPVTLSATSRQSFSAENCTPTPVDAQNGGARDRNLNFHDATAS